MADSREVLSRPAAGPDLTVSYGPHPDHVADVRLPVEGPAPLVMLWHGGYWRAAYDRSYTGPMAVDLVGRGYAVASLEYRRTGADGGWPATFDDVAASVDAVPDLIAATAPGRVDRDRIVFAGHSAGGHLAVWAALRDQLPTDSPWQVPSVGAVGVLTLAPVIDLATGYRLDLDGGAVDALLGGGPDDFPERYAATDPSAFDPPGAPVWLVHGAEDDRVPVEFSRAYAQRTGSQLTELAGAGHFGIVDPLSSVWPAVVTALNSLISLASR
jgi:acetyl esterase/lipase